ncbi:hypothetical protein GWA97_02155 [Flavobacterium sp. LaA7.5]|nr:hypothetical protein [Flavobacterium salilacus subsp. altitudinum]
MTDKELYNHFKTRSHTLDENPGDALWNSIAEKMDNKSTSTKKRLLFFIISGVIAFWLVIYMIISQDKNSLPQQPNLQKQSIVAIDTINTSTTNNVVVTEQEATKESFTESKTSTSINITDAPLKPKTQKIPDTKPSILKSHNSTLKDAVQISKVRFTSQIEFDSLQAIIFKTELDTVKPSGIKLVTQKYNGRILIQVKEKITQVQFDSLVSASFKTYKEEYNTMLIIRAPGLTPYRKRIVKYMPEPGADTISTVNTGYVRFTPIYNAQLETVTEKETHIKSGDVPNNNEAVIQPVYPGGLDMLMKHINEKLIIPDNVPNGIYKVYAHLNINPEGSISKIEIMRKAGYGLDEVVIDAVKKIKTKWEPMIIDGKPANSSFIIPITITIK